jgi:hypothetical protein
VLEEHAFSAEMMTAMVELISTVMSDFQEMYGGLTMHVTAQAAALLLPALISK